MSLDIIDWVRFHELGIQEDGSADHVSVMLMDDFRGSNDTKAKAKPLPPKDFKCKTMVGGTTPKAQPLDALIKKVWKGYFWDACEDWYLSTPPQI